MVARAAVDHLKLDQVLFAPVAAHPLKDAGTLSSFEDRLAMVRLAIAGEPHMQASRADAPRAGGAPNYTLDTLLRLRKSLGPEDTLFCLVGADALLSLQQWHEPARLLLCCDFIAASRPGFSLQRLTEALPETISARLCPAEGTLRRLELTGEGGKRSNLFLLPGLEEDISATQIRDSIAAGAGEASYLEAGVLAPEVVRYIHQHHLYQDRYQNRSSPAEA